MTKKNFIYLNAFLCYICLFAFSEKACAPNLILKTKKQTFQQFIYCRCMCLNIRVCEFGRCLLVLNTQSVITIKTFDFKIQIIDQIECIV